MNEEQLKLVKQSDRYKNVTLLDNPISLEDFLKDKNNIYVQVHSFNIIDLKNYHDLAGFCGAFEWKDGKIISCDGDSYNRSMLIYGYDWWSNDKIPSGLDVLVGSDW